MFVTWQLRVALDSIHNSCNVFQLYIFVHFTTLHACFVCRHRRRYVSTPEDFPCIQTSVTPSPSLKASPWRACTTNHHPKRCTSRRRTLSVSQRRSLKSELWRSRWCFRTTYPLPQGQCTPRRSPPLRAFVSRFTSKAIPGHNIFTSIRSNNWTLLTAPHCVTCIDLNLSHGL